MSEDTPKYGDERLNAIDDKIKALKARRDKLLANKNKKVKASETRAKIVLGGMMLSIARKGPEEAKRLLTSIEKEVTREADKKTLEVVISELKKLVTSAKEAGKQSSGESQKS